MARSSSNRFSLIGVALAALAGCATNRQATERCAGVDSQWLLSEVPFAGDVDCSVCCQRAGADNGVFGKSGGCRCYGNGAEPASESNPEPGASDRYDPYKRKSAPEE